MRFGIVCVGLTISLMSGFLTVPLSAADDKEPQTYKGRAFETWARLLTNDIDAETRAEAYHALSRFSYHDPDTYLKRSKQLVKTNLPNEDSKVVLEAGYAYSNLANWTPEERNALWIAALRSDRPNRRGAAAKGLSGHLLMPTEEATEELADALIEVIEKEKDTSIRFSAFYALKPVILASEYKVEPIVGSGSFKTERLRPEGEYGPIVKKALPVVEKRLNDDDTRVRSAAVDALWDFPPEIAVQQLADQLLVLAKNGNIVSQIRGRRLITEDERMAKEILARFPKYGSKAKPAIPTLEKIRRDFPGVDSILGRSLRSCIEQINAAAD